MENIGLWHERDLSNSANERFTLPMAVILLDEMLNSMKSIITGLNVNTKRITSNLDITKGQIYAEFVLEALIKKGVPRLEAYRNIQRVAFAALEREEDFFDALRKDSNLSKSLTPIELKDIFNAKNHLSASSKIIESVVKKVKATNKKYYNNNNQLR
jgi:adenylosuccinate lyase